jgi:hypothetical protein
MFKRSPETIRRVVLSALAALAVGLAVAPSAQAGDTFWLYNTSKVASLSGTSNYAGDDYPYPNDMSSCVTGQWPGPSATPYKFPPGTNGSLFLTRDLFDDFCYSAVDPQSFAVDSPDPNGGGFWAPLDPFIGDSNLSCGINGATEPVITATVDGLKCTVADAAGAPAATFVSSAAPVRGDSAVALVQHFPSRKSDRATGVHQLTLESPGGKRLGRKRVRLVSGKPRAIEIPLDGKLRKQVARRGSVDVDATLKRVDGERGTGDRAALVLLADDSGLPF